MSHRLTTQLSMAPQSQPQTWESLKEQPERKARAISSNRTLGAFFYSVQVTCKMYISEICAVFNKLIKKKLYLVEITIFCYTYILYFMKYTVIILLSSTVIPWARVEMLIAICMYVRCNSVNKNKQRKTYVLFTLVLSY